MHVRYIYMLVAWVVHSHMHARCIQATQTIAQVEVYHVIATALAISSKSQKSMFIGAGTSVVATPPMCRNR